MHGLSLLNHSWIMHHQSLSYVPGGFGGVVGDSTMHSLDTVKTRQQGFLYQLKYRSMIPAYLTIFKEEGFFRGLYGDSPAILGSLPSTAAFFGTYKISKRKLINEFHFNETISYFIWCLG